MNDTLSDLAYTVPDGITNYAAGLIPTLPFGWYTEINTLTRCVLVKNAAGDTQKGIPYESIEDWVEITI